MPFMADVTLLPDYFKKLSKTLGPVFSFRMGYIYAVVLNDKESITEALVKQSTVFAGRRIGYNISNILNTNLYGIIAKQYSSDFRKYHQQVLSALREFGFGTRMMEERIMLEGRQLIDLLKKFNGSPQNPAHLFSACSLNVIASIIFGQRLSQSDPKLTKLADSFFLCLVSKRRYLDYCPALRFLPKYRAVMKEAFEHMDEQIDFISEELDKSLTSSEGSFTKLFIERHGEQYSRDEIRFMLRDLLIAGTETVSVSLQWALVLLANHPDIQKRLHEEVDSVLSDGRWVSLDDMSQLPYVEACILELTRLKSVIPLSLAHLTSDDAYVGGYFIPKGTTIIPNLYGANKDPDEWPEPDTYRPERFLDESGKICGKSRIINFSLGKRSCLGEFLARQELFLFFTSLVQKFNILPPEGESKIDCNEYYLVNLFPTPFKVRLIAR